jgi:hypothetical protein
MARMPSNVRGAGTWEQTQIARGAAGTDDQ